MKLKNKIAIITGGGKGIGKEICLGLAKEGAKIIIADLDKENSSNVVETIIQNGGDAIYVETNVSSEQSVKNLITKSINKFNQIDILINNAGIRHVKKLEDHNLNDWNDMISVNLTGPYICCQAVIPQMKKIGKGKIINFGSIASFMGRPDRVGYVAAKSGVLGLTRALAGSESQEVELIFISHDGKTAEILGNAFAEDLGFTNVYVLDGGIQSWINSNKPLEKDN